MSIPVMFVHICNTMEREIEQYKDRVDACPHDCTRLDALIDPTGNSLALSRVSSKGQGPGNICLSL